MENKISFHLTSILFLFLIFVTTVHAEVTLQMKKENEKKLVTFSKKFKKLRKREILIIDDNMKSTERFDVKNIYFFFSYHSCLIPSVPYGESNINDTRIVVFNRSESCGAKDKHEQVLEISSAGGRKPEDIENFLTSLSTLEHVKYAQLTKINGAEGKISAELRMSEKEKSFGDIRLKWVIEVLCRGKSTEQFQMIFFTDGEEVTTRLTNNDYRIPEDVQKVISSFRCI